MATLQTTPVRVLAEAVHVALQAPSVLNTQPWRWRVERDEAVLLTDPRRHLRIIDPDGRLLMLSCGAAMHHACVALAAEGIEFELVQLPADAGAGEVAVLRYRGRTEPSEEDQRLRSAIPLRLTDRRPFAGMPVTDDALDGLRHAARRGGAHLHVVRPQDLTDIAVAAGHATTTLLSDADYRTELRSWIREPGEGRDGVPIDTIGAPDPRAVPLVGTGGRRFGPSVASGVDLADREARYCVVVTDGDDPRDWLRGGAALSAVLLTATVEGLASSAMSDLIEDPSARHMLRRVIGGVGHPAIGVRVGHPAPGDPPRRAPRRPADEMVEVVGE